MLSVICINWHPLIRNYTDAELTKYTKDMKNKKPLFLLFGGDTSMYDFEPIFKAMSDAAEEGHAYANFGHYDIQTQKVFKKKFGIIFPGQLIEFTPRGTFSIKGETSGITYLHNIVSSFAPPAETDIDDKWLEGKFNYVLCHGKGFRAPLHFLAASAAFPYGKIKIGFNNDADTAELFGVSEYPTFIFHPAKGSEVRVQGNMSYECSDY